MNINYGIIAYYGDGTEDSEKVEIVHFCGYEKPPTWDDFFALEKELETNPEFGLVGKMDGLILHQARPSVVERYRKIVG